MTPKLSAKYLSIDVLRGLAILGVIGVHLFGATFWGIKFPWGGIFRNFQGIPACARIFYPMTLGYLGVTLFFVLSGYCIHLSFLSYRKKQGGQFEFNRFLSYFFIRRFFRIYPVYFLAVLFFTFVYRHEHYEGSALMVQFFSHFFLVHNFSNFTYNAVNESFWSLAYEWQLYLIFPFFLLLRAKLGLERAFGTVLVCSMIYTFVFTLIQTDWIFLQEAVFRTRYILPWFFGVYLCEKHQSGKTLFPRSASALIACFAVGLVCTQLYFFRNVIWELFTPIFAWTIEFYLARERVTLPERFFAGLGVISYSLYLLHGPLLEWGLQHFKPLLIHGYPYNQLTIGGLVLIVIPLVVLAALSYRFIERPCHEFGQRQTRETAPTPEVESALNNKVAGIAPLA